MYKIPPQILTSLTLAFSLSAWAQQVATVSDEKVVSLAPVIVQDTRDAVLKNCLDPSLSLAMRANCQISERRILPEGERLLWEQRAKVNKMLEDTSFSLTPGDKRGTSEPTYNIWDFQLKLRAHSGWLRLKAEVRY